MANRSPIALGLVLTSLLGCGDPAPQSPAPAKKPQAGTKPVRFNDFAREVGFKLWWPNEPTAGVTEHSDTPGLKRTFRAECVAEAQSETVTFSLSVLDRTGPTDRNALERQREGALFEDDQKEKGLATVERTNFLFGKNKYLAVDATLVWSRDKSRSLVVVTDRYTFRLACLMRNRDLLTRDPVDRFIKSFELIE